MSDCLYGEQCGRKDWEHPSADCFPLFAAVNVRMRCRRCGQEGTPMEHVCPAAALAALNLDVDAETARAVHRIVRGFHDGECPSCHQLFEAYQVLDPQGGSTCPKCGFSISAEEKQAAIRLFAPHMDRALVAFLKWRSGATSSPGDGPSPAADTSRPSLRRESAEAVYDCELTAHDTGDGWALMVEDGHQEVVAYLSWPPGWPEYVTGDFLRGKGFRIV
jgi:hypothetical protein